MGITIRPAVTVTQLANRLGISRAAVYDRIKRGWSRREATTIPRLKDGKQLGGK